MHKYIAGGYPDIKSVEVVRESKSSVWTKGPNMFGKEVDSKQAKASKYSMIFDTFEEAREWLIDREAKRIDAFQSKIDSSRNKIVGYSNLKEDGLQDKGE